MSHPDSMRLSRDPVDVLHAAVKARPEGITGAAKLIGRSAGVLHNKFSEAMPHYEITVRKALAIAQAINCPAFAEAVCEQFDGVFLHLPEGAAGQDDVLQAYLGIIQSMGDLSREFTEARADGIIDPAEFNALKLRTNRTVVALMHLVSELEGMVREVPAKVAPVVSRLGAAR